MPAPRPTFSVLVQLMKLRVILLLQVTAICSVFIHDLLVRAEVMAHPEGRRWIQTLSTCWLVLLGGTLSAGGANAINMWYDRDIDAQMTRTQSRPIPNHQVEPTVALLFGILVSILGVVMLLILHPIAAFWSAFSVAFYVLVYTMWLKRRTPQNIVIGGIAGATPPLIGWAAAAEASLGTNPLALGSAIPWTLFLLIFLWTPPHFWALALYRSGEYARAGIPMMNEVRGAEHTLLQSKVYAVLLIALAFVPLLWPEDHLAWPWIPLAGALGFWYAASVFAIDPHERKDRNGRIPSAFASFMRSLRYLAFMHVALVGVAALSPYLA